MSGVTVIVRPALNLICSSPQSDIPELRTRILATSFNVRQSGFSSMFHTFNIENSPKSPYGSGGSTPTAKQPQRRHQISRACGWCRTYRIKCDTSIPCRNCTTKGRQCIAATGKEEFRTFRGAVKFVTPHRLAHHVIPHRE